MTEHAAEVLEDDPKRPEPPRPLAFLAGLAMILVGVAGVYAWMHVG